MKRAATILAFLICTGCGYDPGYMKPKIAAMSDYELLRQWEMVSAVPPNPQIEWVYDEMQRRGILGDARPRHEVAGNQAR